MDDDDHLPLLREVDEMTFTEYLKSQRTLTQDEVDEITRKHDAADTFAEDVYEAHAHHIEYGAAEH